MMVLSVGTDSPRMAAILLAVATAASMFSLGAHWAAAIDIGGDHAGVLSACMNTTGQIGSISSPIVAAWLVDHYASWALPALRDGRPVRLLGGHLALRPPARRARAGWPPGPPWWSKAPTLEWYVRPWPAGPAGRPNCMPAITIVGAGVAGLTIGHQLARQGYAVTVLESHDVVGGLGRSWHYGDFHFDVGPHRFHTENPKVEAFVREILAEDAHEIPRKSGVRMFGRFHEWPLRPSILLSMPFSLMFRAGLDLFNKEQLAGESFEADIVNKYGRTLYEIFFKPYTEKFLFYSPAELHRDWARAGVNRAVIDKRQESDGLWSLLKNTLLPQPVDTTFLYPPTGVGRFSERAAANIERMGGRVLTKRRVDGDDRARRPRRRAARRRRACSRSRTWCGRRPSRSPIGCSASRASTSSTCRRSSTTSRSTRRTSSTSSGPTTAATRSSRACRRRRSSPRRWRRRARAASASSSPASRATSAGSIPSATRRR